MLPPVPQSGRCSPRLRFLSLGRVMACLSLLGLTAFSYFCGAAAMYFELPSSGYLQSSFLGAEAWYERACNQSRQTATGDDAQATVRADDPYRTCDGFTLYTTNQGSTATLLDMRGNVVHRWKLPFRQAWPNPPHVRDPFQDDKIHWFTARLFPNGDLLAVYHAEGDTPYGYGLAKLDQDSKLLWAYSDRVHHDVDVGEDGLIYTLTQESRRELPAGLESIRAPYIADQVVVLSADGQELAKVPVLEAFRDSPYALMLTAINHPSPRERARDKSLAAAKTNGDILHANSIRVLNRSVAPKFPLFKPGQVLISLRSLDTLAVLDVQSRTVVWAAQGLWRNQHNAEFLDNGNLCVFDNLGALGGSRVLEYDPGTQAMPWSYSNESSAPFVAVERGMKQRLDNGNTLIVDPNGGRILEVTRAKELVWECSCPFQPDSQGQSVSSAALTSARRYRAEELTFLKGGSHARP